MPWRIPQSLQLVNYQKSFYFAIHYFNLMVSNSPINKKYFNALL